MRAPITYMSDQADDYVKAISKAVTLNELRMVLEDYKNLFPDAYAQAPTSAAEFKAWRAGLRKERKREFAGIEFMERFGALLLPEVLIEAGMVANQFKVPWGCAYIRLRDVGRIVERNRVSHVVKEKA